MFDLSKITGSEWDKGNIDKSYKKHGISSNEAESLFLDEGILFLEDIKHSEKEKRFIAIGKSTDLRILFVVFTLRGDKIRIISVRLANKKEREQYAKTT